MLHSSLGCARCGIQACGLSSALCRALLPWGKICVHLLAASPHAFRAHDHHTFMPHPQLALLALSQRLSSAMTQQDLLLLLDSSDDVRQAAVSPVSSSVGSQAAFAAHMRCAGLHSATMHPTCRCLFQACMV